MGCGCGTDGLRILNNGLRRRYFTGLTPAEQSGVRSIASSEDGSIQDNEGISNGIEWSSLSSAAQLAAEYVQRKGTEKE